MRTIMLIIAGALSFFSIELKSTTYRQRASHLSHIISYDLSDRKTKLRRRQKRYKNRKYKKKKRFKQRAFKYKSSKPKDHRFSNQHKLRRMYRST